MGKAVSKSWKKGLITIRGFVKDDVWSWYRTSSKNMDGRKILSLLSVLWSLVLRRADHNGTNSEMSTLSLSGLQE